MRASTLGQDQASAGLADASPWGRRDAAKAAAPDKPASGKWSARKTLAFVVLSCGAFWALVVWAVLAFLK